MFVSGNHIKSLGSRWKERLLSSRDPQVQSSLLIGKSWEKDQVLLPTSRHPRFSPVSIISPPSPRTTMSLAKGIYSGPAELLWECGIKLASWLSLLWPAPGILAQFCVLSSAVQSSVPPRKSLRYSCITKSCDSNILPAVCSPSQRRSNSHYWKGKN